MSILSQIKKPEDDAIICTIFGEAGRGKTSLAATFPNPVVIQIEKGVKRVPESFRPNAFPLIANTAQLWEQLTALCTEKHEFKTVVIDSITQLEQLFISEIVKNDPNKPKSINQACGGYGAGWMAVAQLHTRMRDAAQYLSSKGIHVIFIAHADISTITPPDGEPYMSYDLRLNKKSISPYTDNVDLIGFLKLQTYIVGEDGGQKKAITDGQRVLVCNASACNISKNGYGITKDLPVELGKNPLEPYIKVLQQTPTKQTKEKETK